MSDPRMAHTATTVTLFVGASLIAGKTIPEIVALLDEKLDIIRRECAIKSKSPLISPTYSITKAAADALRNRR